MNETAEEQQETTHIAVSICLSTFNRAAQLQKVLAAYTELNTAGIRWELIVVDNNSTDATAAVLQQAATRLPLIHFVETKPGKSAACNAAIRKARGELIIFTDDDVIPPHDYLPAYVAAAARWPDDAIFGAQIDPLFPPGTDAWLRDPNWHFSDVVYARYAPTDLEGYVTEPPFGPSFAVRRAALADHDFPEHIGPRQGSYIMGCDVHLLHALREDGWRYVYIPSICVQHIVRPEQITAKWLAFRLGNYGRAIAYLIAEKWQNDKKGSLHKLVARRRAATLRTALRVVFCSPFLTRQAATKLRMYHQFRRGTYLELRNIAQQSTQKSAQEAAH